MFFRSIPEYTFKKNKKKYFARVYYSRGRRHADEPFEFVRVIRLFVERFNSEKRR